MFRSVMIPLAFCLCFFVSDAYAQMFGTVNFDFDSDQLDAEAQAEVQRIAEQLRAIDTYKPTVVVGYTDAVGSFGYNDQLGLRRAQAVAQALIAAGVPVDRVGTVESRGKNELLIAVATPERRNRRVTVSLADMLAACRTYREIPLEANDVGDALQTDLRQRLSDAITLYQQLANSGSNPAAYQMAGAARHDCEQAVGYQGRALRKVEYSQKCFCSHARAEVAMGRLQPPS